MKNGKSMFIFIFHFSLKMENEKWVFIFHFSLSIENGKWK